MPIPVSYRVQEVLKRCETCDHCSSCNGMLYCRRGEVSITKACIDNKNKLILDILNGTQVDPNGVCDEWESADN